uniref:Pseudouridine synthase n=1 Tax=candidate division WOR-3 bacterium TaxID=2052148 RepID=A0A7C3N7E4_UNCW3
MKIRINKFISQISGISRREVDEMIKESRIAVNGKLATLGQMVDENDDIEIDGMRLNIKKKDFTYILFYKPKNCITSRSDEKGRPTVMDFLPKNFERLRPAGRLDFDTEGALILTDDGDFINFLIHPKNQIVKVYRARIFGNLGENEIKRLKKGINVEERFLKLDNVKTIHYDPSKDKSDIEIILTHGKNHEIKDILKAIGHPVIYLKRLSVGNMTIKGLKAGEFKVFKKNDFKNV